MQIVDINIELTSNKNELRDMCGLQNDREEHEVISANVLICGEGLNSKKGKLLLRLLHHTIRRLCYV